MVVEQLPHPRALNTDKIEQLMCNKNRRFDTLLPQTRQLKQGKILRWPTFRFDKKFVFSAFANCSSDDKEPVIIYVSKLFSVNRSALSQNRHK